jgi:alkylated DNA repair dioxygenase AlkB
MRDPSDRSQTSLPLEPAPVHDVDLGEDCSLEVRADFAAAEHERLLQTLTRELPWTQELYFRGGRCLPAPRLTSFHGDAGCAYSYSGISYAPSPFTESLARLRARLRDATGHDFNSVLANLYRDGHDSLGFHADDEPELGPSRDDVIIASVSLGAPRRFVLKHRKDGRRLCYELGGGSLLVMRGRTQQRWVHGVPKSQSQLGPRLNLTYRIIVARSGSAPS